MMKCHLNLEASDNRRHHHHQYTKREVELLFVSRWRWCAAPQNIRTQLSKYVTNRMAAAFTVVMRNY